jgi:3-phytase
MKPLLRNLAVIVVFTTAFACKPALSPDRFSHLTGPVKVTALIETPPVSGQAGNDGADDAAIWVHPLNTEESLIIATHKDTGLYTYDLRGKELFFLPCGKVNNVDIRQNFQLGKIPIDLVAASNRSDSSLILLRIFPNGQLKEITARKIRSEITDEVYGCCLYESPTSGIVYAFINGKNGQVEQYELFATTDDLVDARLVRQWSLPSQVEGMVADDESGWLFIGEEDCCIRRYPAEPDQEPLEFVISGSRMANPNISFDIEGLAIYTETSQTGYLIASSQGNNSYAVFDRKSPHDYLFSFRIGEGRIDGAEETDGIEVNSARFGSNFPKGLLVVQDGYNTSGLDTLPQNFKLISWQDIMKEAGK